MKVRAAIAVEAGKPLEIDEIDLDGPKDGECLVRLGLGRGERCFGLGLGVGQCLFGRLGVGSGLGLGRVELALARGQPSFEIMGAGLGFELLLFDCLDASQGIGLCLLEVALLLA